MIGGTTHWRCLQISPTMAVWFVNYMKSILWLLINTIPDTHLGWMLLEHHKVTGSEAFECFLFESIDFDLCSS